MAFPQIHCVANAFPLYAYLVYAVLFFKTSLVNHHFLSFFELSICSFIDGIAKNQQGFFFIFEYTLLALRCC
jgi:hypothetical protein